MVCIPVNINYVYNQYGPAWFISAMTNWKSSKLTVKRLLFLPTNVYVTLNMAGQRTEYIIGVHIMMMH